MHREPSRFLFSLSLQIFAREALEVFAKRNGVSTLVKEERLTRKLLNDALEAVPKPWTADVAGQAHHIFPVKEFNTPLGERLHHLGIDLNGVENGVWLPTKDYPGRKEALHWKNQLSEYNREVRRRLINAGVLSLPPTQAKKEALAVLGELKNDLLNRRIVLHSFDVAVP